MTVQEVEKLVHELPPQDQLKIAAGICQQLSAVEINHDSDRLARRDRMLAAIARCDEIAESIDGEFDSAEDLRRIREGRIADIERAVFGR